MQKMTVDSALKQCDEWCRVRIDHLSANQWRSIADVLAEEVRDLRETITLLEEDLSNDS